MISFLAMTLTLTGQAAAPDVGPMSQDPYHRLVLRNKMVEVYDVVLPPKAVMRFHAHPTNHLAVLIRPGTLQNELLGGPAKLNPTGPAGTVVYVGPGAPHRQTNIGAGTVHFVAVELAPGKAKQGEQVMTGFAQEEQTRSLSGTGCAVVVEKQDARAWRCRLAPGQSLVQSRSASFLRIAVTAGVLRTGSDRKVWRMAPGRPAWEERAARVQLTNVGAAPTEFVDIEIR